MSSSSSPTTARARARPSGSGYGQSLEELIRELLADRDVAVRAATGLEETAGPANTFLSQVGSEDSGRPGTRSTAPCTGGRWTARCTSERSAGEQRADAGRSGRRPSRRPRTTSW